MVAQAAFEMAVTHACSRVQGGGAALSFPITWLEQRVAEQERTSGEMAPGCDMIIGRTSYRPVSKRAASPRSLRLASMILAASSLYEARIV